MTEKEKSKLKTAISLLTNDDCNYHEAMDILYELVYGTKGKSKKHIGNIKSVDIKEIMRKE